MASLADMTWVEWRKAIRSRMPLWTALGSLFMPLGIAFVLFVAKHPEVSRELGLISAKADLMAFAAADWPAFLGLYAQIIGAGGFILFVIVISWTFGREFADGTLKDMMAVPVSRANIVLAKYLVFALWCLMLTVVICGAGLATGALIGIEDGGQSILLQGGARVATTALLAIAVVAPFAFVASVGRGYLLPLGAAFLTLMATNLMAIIGRAEFFPWGVPFLHAMGTTSLAPISYGIALLTGAAGILGTILWWKFAEQSR